LALWAFFCLWLDVIADFGDRDDGQ